MSEQSGGEILLDVLRSEGVRHVFGNPGTTELPFVGALASAGDISYVLGLQEATVVAMADGYAQATGQPAFVNLHTACGLGNGMGNLTNAVANRTPLVVTAGQQDERHLAAEPLLSADLVALAAPVSKWAHEVRNVGELATMVRRAFHDAAAPPRGPVFLSLRMSTLDERTGASVPPPSRLQYRTVAADLEDLAALLAGTGTGRLAIVAADDVAASGGVGALVELAETLAAPVFGATLHGAGLFPPGHALWRGMLPYTADEMRKVLEPFDRILLIGDRPLMVALYTDATPVPPTARLVQLASEPAGLARTYPVELGVVGDAKLSLQALGALVRRRADPAAAAALAAARDVRQAEIQAGELSARQQYGPAPMHPIAAAHALVRGMPPDAIVLDEAITAGVHIRKFHNWTRPGRYFYCRGAGLGWGMPAAVGVALAHSGSVPVVCAVGDGSAMYSPQALWTAARERLPVTFVVFNNRQYLLLKLNMHHLQRGPESYLGMDLVDPAVDYVELGRAHGVAAERVEDTAGLTEAVRAAGRRDGPSLIEVPTTSG